MTTPGIGILATPTPALGLLTISPLPANPPPNVAFGESPPDLLGDLANPPVGVSACPAPGIAIPVGPWPGVATLKLLLGERADPVGGEEAEDEAWWWCA